MRTEGLTVAGSEGNISSLLFCGLVPVDRGVVVVVVLLDGRKEETEEETAVPAPLTDDWGCGAAEVVFDDVGFAPQAAAVAFPFLPAAPVEEPGSVGNGFPLNALPAATDWPPHAPCRLAAERPDLAVDDLSFRTRRPPNVPGVDDEDGPKPGSEG